MTSAPMTWKHEQFPAFAAGLRARVQSINAEIMMIRTVRRARADQREARDRCGRHGMIGPRRASMIVALFLLAWAATAQGECAWVMWDGTTVLQGAPEKEWTPLGAFPTHDRCQASHRLTVDGYLKKVRDMGSQATRVGNEIVVSGAGPSVSHEFICLPDAVDPRGPKAK